MRRWMSTLIVLAVVSGIGCAGPGKLAQKSENKLAEGDVWQAWRLATRALDKAPANPRAREAAASAARSISEDWQRRITALADVDSMAAAEQVLQFVQFRTDAIPYTTVAVSQAWLGTESSLRRGAAQSHYADGVAAARTQRPKKAYAEFREAERFVAPYRDAARRADTALRDATTRVAVLPLASAAGDVDLGRAIAAEWSGALTEHMPAGDSFTRIVPADNVDQALSVSDLRRSSRGDAVRLGTKIGADRVVWGTIGPVESHAGLRIFQRSIWRPVSHKDAAGNVATSWVEIPIQVVARTRKVSVDVTYEVISTHGGATLAREHTVRDLDARAVWTSYVPDGGPETYTLVTDAMRSGNPELCRQVESDWASVVGTGTTLAQVLEARRARTKAAPDPREVLARYAAGAAFVLLEDLPSTRDLAHAALTAGWPKVEDSLARLDAVDDVDLDALSAGDTAH